MRCLLVCGPNNRFKLSGNAEFNRKVPDITEVTKLSSGSLFRCVAQLKYNVKNVLSVLSDYYTCGAYFFIILNI